MRFIKAIILVLIALAAIAFAVANSGDVGISLNPIASVPDNALRAPLFVVVFAAMILGVLVGGIATWVGQGRYRRATRLHRREAERLRAELDRARAAAPPSLP